MKKNAEFITSSNHVEFIFDGIHYAHQFAAAIRKAQKSIHLQTYIFEMGTFGQMVHAELLAAAQRGVHVYLLLDSIGSRKLAKEHVEAFASGGVFFSFFNVIKWQWPFQWGRRLHHKVLVIDHQFAFVGGINIERKTEENRGFPRLDFAVYLEGPAVAQITWYAQKVFKKAFKGVIDFTADGPLQVMTETVSPTFQHRVGISVNDWPYGYKEINRRYLELVLEAQEQITIINSYFFPRKKFMKDLVAAAKRGVKVRLILPQISDWPSYVRASEYLYTYFLRNHVEIYQWTKSILHGKLATCDGKWATIGSYNLNYLSYLHSLEMNVDVFSPTFTKDLNQQIEGILHIGCVKIELQDFTRKRTFIQNFMSFCCYLFFATFSYFNIGQTHPEEMEQTPSPGKKRYQIFPPPTLLMIFFIGVVGHHFNH